MASKKRRKIFINELMRKIHLLSFVLAEIETWNIIAYYPNTRNMKHTIIITRVEENLDEFFIKDEQRQNRKRRVSR